MRARRRWIAVAIALLALGFLASMVWSGREPENRWLVKPVVSGVLATAPDRITRVEVAGMGRRLALERGAGGWTAASVPVPAALATHVEAALKFLHASAPVRVLGPEEYRATGLGEFGLVPPRYTVTVFASGRMVLEAAFGAPNPQKVLQYVRLGGHEEIHLMPRFLGEEWERVIDAAGTS